MGTNDSIDEKASSHQSPPGYDHEAQSTSVETVPTEKGLLRRGGRTTFDGGDLDYYKYAPIDSYEGRHRWDPTFEWDPKDEKKVVRKIDLKICSWVCLMVSCGHGLQNVNRIADVP